MFHFKMSLNRKILDVKEEKRVSKCAYQSHVILASVTSAPAGKVTSLHGTCNRTGTIEAERSKECAKK